jgi:hypothetical protein
LQQQHQSRWIGSKVPTQLSSVRGQMAVSSACRYSLVTLLSIDMLSFVRSSPRKASKTQTLPAIDTDDPHSSLTASSPLIRKIEGGGGRRRGNERVNTADALPFGLRGTSQGQRYRHGQGQAEGQVHEPLQMQRQYELVQVGRWDGMRLSKAKDKGQDTESDRDRDSQSPTTSTGVCLAPLVLSTLFPVPSHTSFLSHCSTA